MAGLPDAVTKRAKEILRALEDRDYRSKLKDEFQINLFEAAVDQVNAAIDPRYEELVSRLKEIDLNSTTPLDAMNILKMIKDDFCKD